MAFYARPIPSKEEPKALKTEITTRGQIWMPEEVLLWGADNAEPLRILQAVADSPTTTSCLDRITDFVCGSGFSDPALMELVIDAEGTTLYELHCQLAEYLTHLDGIALNFKYNEAGEIIASYNLPMEGVRLVAPDEGQTVIKFIKSNPYYGTSLYQAKFSTKYNVYDKESAPEEIQDQAEDYKGQAYYFAKKRSLFKHYPVPKYWSGKKWIYADAKLSEFVAEYLDNGFFQSVLLNVIGDPNAWSTNPRQMKEQLKADGVTKESVPTKTQGEEFNENMQAMFSGSQKAGGAYVNWALNKDDVTLVQPFPTNANYELIGGSFIEAIRGITIATKVPAVLANLPQQASSLGSDGNAMEKAVEMMQSRTSKDKQTLENIYNNIILPNLETPVKQKVKIVDFKPFSMSVTVEDKFWDVIPAPDRIKFVNANVPGVQIEEQPAAVAPTLDENGQPLPGEAPPPKPNEALKSLSLRDWDRVAGIKRRFQAGKMSQAEVEGALLSYGFTKQEIDEWLLTNTPTTE